MSKRKHGPERPVLLMSSPAITPVPRQPHTEEGVILNWYLLVGNVAPPAPGEAQTLNATMLAMITPVPNDHVNFTAGLAGVMYSNNAHYVQTISDQNGSSTVTITATGEEAVTIIVIPTVHWRSSSQCCTRGCYVGLLYD